MFEDAYAKHKHWRNITYEEGALDGGVREGAEWAEDFVREFAAKQAAMLKWLKPK